MKVDGETGEGLLDELLIAADELGGAMRAPRPITPTW